MAKPNKFYSIATQADNTADIYIYGDIVSGYEKGWQDYREIETGDTSALSIVQDIADIDADSIRVHISSFGGLTNEGIAIFNVLINHPAHITTIIDGFACSAASIVAMAGDERLIGASSMIMIHNAWTWASGNAHDMRAQADVLDQISAAAANAYMRGFNGTREQLDSLLEGPDHDGTWMDAQTAVDWGFCTGIMANPSGAGVNQSVRGKIVSYILHAQEEQQISNASNDASDIDNNTDSNTSTAHDDNMSIAQKILFMGV